MGAEKLAIAEEVINKIIVYREKLEEENSDFELK